MSNDRIWEPGVDVLSRRDTLRPSMGETLGQDWPETSRVDWAVGPHTLDALFWSFTVLPRSCRQPIPCRSAKRKRWRLEIYAGRNYR